MGVFSVCRVALVTAAAFAFAVPSDASSVVFRLASDSHAACACPFNSAARDAKAAAHRRAHGGQEAPEVLMFTIKADAWRGYDWKKVTTIGVFRPLTAPDIAEMICKAHSEGVRVVPNGKMPKAEISDPAQRRQHAQQLLATVRGYCLDGVNVDFEAPMSAGAEAASLVAYQREVFTTFKAASAHYQVTNDVAWSPKCVDGRCFDVSGMAPWVDYFLVMSYDLRGQTRPDAAGHCLAGANAPLWQTVAGVREYLALPGVPASKLVFGAPWYGYRYECLPNVTVPLAGPCAIKAVPYVGSPCSDAAGRELNFADIEALYRAGAAPAGIQWDEPSQTPYMTMLVAAERRALGAGAPRPADGRVTHIQYWFDNPASLALKYKAAADLQLRGVGIWHADALNYTHPNTNTKLMWDLLP